MSIRLAPFRPENPQELARQLAALERNVLELQRALATAGVKVFSDSELRVYSQLDTTAQLALDVSNVSPGTTRYLEMPDADVDLSIGYAAVSEDFLQTAAPGSITTSGTQYGAGVFLTNGGSVTGLVTGPQRGHPGVCRFGVDAVVNSSSGWLTCPHAAGGGDMFLCTFRTPTSFANLQTKIGQISGNTVSTSEPLGGVYLWQTSGTSTFGFKTASAGVRTAGATTTLSTNTWYTMIVLWAQDRGSVRCVLAQDDGTKLLDYSISTNLPGTVLIMYGQAHALTTVAVASTRTFDLDFMQLRIGSRGSPLPRIRPDFVGEWMLP